MKRPEILIPTLFAACLFGFQLGERGLWASHEARAAQHAQVMLDTGDWLLPRLYDGTVDLQKPPGYYWLVALTGMINGGEIDATVVRVPAAFCGVLTVFLVSAYLSFRSRPTAALIAGLGLATFVHFTGLGRVARIDMPLTCAITAGLLAWRSGWFILGWGAFAGAVLLKGPIGVILPVAVLSVNALTLSGRSEESRLRSLVPSGLSLNVSTILGFILFCLIVTPWFYLADHATDGSVIRNFLWYHNVERALGSSESLASYPWWYYLPRLAGDALPWTPSLIFFTMWMTRRRGWTSAPDARFGLVWVSVMFLILSCVSFKRADYLAPLYPGLAIVLGCTAECWLADRSERVRRWFWVAFATVIGALAAGWLCYERFVVPTLDARQDPQRFAHEVRRRVGQEVILFRVENHALTFHAGWPVRTVLEWAELRRRLTEPGQHHVIVPVELDAECRRQLDPIELTIIADSRQFLNQPRRPVLLLQTDP